MSQTNEAWVWVMKRKVLAFGMLVVFIAGILCFLQSPERSYLSFAYSRNPTQKQIDVTEICLSTNSPGPRYCTINEKSTMTFGYPFNLSSNYLKNLGIPLKDFAPIRRENLDDFVFATAANKDYFHVAMDAIGHVQKLLSNHTIYFYDLDFSRSEEHIRKIKSLCRVIYRKFNFSRYPSHVQYLKNYAFKPLIVHEVLSENPRVFWIDSSIRFKTRNLSLTLDEVFSSGGIITFDKTSHSNFAVTHEEMYRYLPISTQAAANTVQYGANSIYMHRTEEMYTRIIFWWVLCALREECMAPTRKLSCNFKGKDVWAGCHRFDQSSLNILMANHFLYNVSRYSSRSNLLAVIRHSAHKELLVVCPTGNKTKSSGYFS